MASSKITVRMDASVKDELEKVLSSLGMNLTTGINVWARAIIRHGGIPFYLTTAQSPQVKPPSQQQAATMNFLANTERINQNGFTPEDEAAFERWDSGEYKLKFDGRLE